MRASTAPAFYWTCPFHLFLGAIEGHFLRSAADTLIVCFKARTKNCLCGKSMPGLCSVVVISPVSPNYCPPHGKVYWRGILLLLWASNLSEPSTVSEWGQIREGRREIQGWNASHWDGLRGYVQVERGVWQNKRTGLFWGWLLRVVGSALVSSLGGRRVW